MDVEVLEQTAAELAEYGRVSIAFRVESRFHVEPQRGKSRGWTLMEEPVSPYEKDYDALPGEGPEQWALDWDISRWGILSAFDGGRRVGGAAVAWRTPGLNLLGGRDDLAVLWDLRVCPDRRGQGVGRRLFAYALAWAQARGCRQLLVETQNINVPACRFYARQGCTLGAVNPEAYEDAPDEIQLLWFRDIEE